MTYKELYLKEHPDLNSDQLQDALDAFCPGDYFQNAPNVGKPGCVDQCYECWNKELLEEKTEGFKAKDLVPVGEEVAKGLEKGILEPKTSVNFDGAEFQKKVYETLGIPEFKSLTHEEILEYRNTLYEELLKKQGELFKDVAEKRMELDKEDLEEIDNDILKEMIKSDEKEPSIKDSGTRREFSTGAVRDIQEGKGRCDLMPLDVISEMYTRLYDKSNRGSVFLNIDTFKQTGVVDFLYDILTSIPSYMFGNDEDMLLEVAKHFEAGAAKYGEYNWQKGIPTHCYIDSAVRHYLKFLRGDKDEPHDRAFCWNILCCIWTCKHKPELNDYPRKEKTDEQL